MTHLSVVFRPPDRHACDVAVVGAGPAGAWSALRLARAGARVIILDPSHPREKPCGGGLTGRALDLLAAHVPVAAVPARAIRRVRFDSEPLRGTARSNSVSLDVPPPAPHQSESLTVVSRRLFDAWLLDAATDAGARLLPARVRDLARARGGWRLDTSLGSLHAPVVIGADGVNSLVRRRLARPFARADLSIAAGFFVHGVEDDAVVIGWTTDPPGYLWSFPRPGHLAIGMCGQADSGASASDLLARTHAWIARTGLGSGGRLERYAWPIPALSSDSLASLCSAGPGWMLVGDAAGLVDPLTREGLYYALASADRAADALLRHGSAAPAWYDQALRQAFHPELRRAADLRAWFFRPATGRLVVEALESSPAISAVMRDLVAGRQPYVGLRRRLLATGEWRLALRLLAADPV